MKVAYIASGAGGMYCGTCLHDNTLASAMLKKGHQVALIPTYTPIRTDEEPVSIDHIFYGGINVYLQQKSALFRHTPAAFDQLLDSRALLKWASQFSSSTDPKDLGALTVSVLKGEEGHQKKELLKLLEWLKNSYRPDLLHLNNSMFVGFARLLKKEMGVPVLCSLQGEDLFLEQLLEPHKSEALDLLRERAKDVDGFIATSIYYANFMSGYLKIPRERIHVVRLGINLEGYSETTNLPEKPFVIGYLARICPEKGLHLLIDAFIRLNQRTHQIKLRIAGYLSPRDRVYLEDLVKKIHSAGLQNRFENVGEVGRSEKIAFYKSLHIFSMPSTYQEPKGLSILEALANGVPVVQPGHGAFPEMIEATGGGILVAPNSAKDLANGISKLYNDGALRAQLGQEGKRNVHNFFSDSVMAEATVQVFQLYL